MAVDNIPIQIESTPCKGGTYKGKRYKDGATLNSLAHKMIDQLRSQELPIWQAKSVLQEAIRLLDWETLK